MSILAVIYLIYVKTLTSWNCTSCWRRWQLFHFNLC